MAEKSQSDAVLKPAASVDKEMYDPVNSPPDEGPQSGPKLSERQKAVVDRRHCNALLEIIKDERHGLLWWQTTPISYSFSDSIVRDRLLKLMKTEKVRLMDRNYMMTLSDRLVEANWELVHNRIEARRKWEIEREKQLVFEGKLPLSDGPPGFAKHPFFMEDMKVKKRLAEMEAKKLARMRRRTTSIVLPTFEYPDHVKLSVAKGEEEEDDENVFERGDFAVDKDECIERSYLQTLIEKEVEEKIIDPPEFHEKHYEALGIKQIKHALTVDRMFKCADRIFLKVS